MAKMAYFDSTHDMPEEILTAAGFEPYKIMGDVSKPLEKVAPFLAAFFCPVARSFLVEALEHSGQWAGIVFAHGCDATNRHFDVWKAHVQTPYLYWLNVPLHTDRTAAVFYRGELERFRASLEGHFGVKVTARGLRKAVAESNMIKAKLRHLASLRASKDIPNVEYFDLMKQCLQLPKHALITKLDQIRQDWERRPLFPHDMLPVLLTGSDLTYREFMEILEHAGLRVVRDDLSEGERYFAQTIPEDADPIDALIHYHFSIPRPPTKHPPAHRLEYLIKCLEATPCRGIVSQNVKFCEPFALDAVLINQALKDRGYPLIHIERDYTPNIDHTLVNRLQAFRELVA